LGFDGNRPLLPFRLSVRTTVCIKVSFSVSFRVVCVISTLTFFNHSYGQTFLKATELTPVSPPLIDGTVLIAQTYIFGPLLHSPLEKSFASY
jgi:hypothetical protein